jgi:hypothetical protein
MDAHSEMPKKEEDKLTALVDLQTSDGHFKWGDGLERFAGKTKEELMANRPSFAGHDDLWVSAIVIVLLEAMEAEKELWELVVAKARKFLAKSLTQQQIEMLLAEAGKLV